MPLLRIARSVVQEILAHARRDAPREACGLLAGREDAGGAREIHRAFPCRNASSSPAFEYVLHPEDQLRTILRIEDELSLEALGVYHSHPRGPPGPSEADAARANWPGGSYLVVWLAPSEAWGAWRWDGRAFRAEETDLEAP